MVSALNGFIMCAWVMPEIVAGFCWYAYLYQGGTLDTFLHHFGLSQDWLYTTPMLAIIIANIWRGTAFSMLVYSAGHVRPAHLTSSRPPKSTAPASSRSYGG